jgi:predicted dienelactone hydrolase
MATLASSGCMGMIAAEPETPQTLGPRPVGVTTMRVEDDARDRKLTVEVWYPAAERSSAEPTVYNIEAIGTTVARLKSAAGTHRDAAPAREEGARPVVLLSHGAGSTRYGNASLAEVLASHGYIVAAPDHVGHTMSSHVFGIDNTERAQSAFDRPIDLSRVLDALEERSRGSKFVLKGLVDTNRVAVAGHSFGGAAALGMIGARFDADRQARECKKDDADRRCAAVPVFGPGQYRYRDPRIGAALLITPAGFDLYRADGIAEVDAPALVVGAERDTTTPYLEYSKPIYESLKAPHYLLDLEQAGHLTATDVCEIVDSVGFPAKMGGDPRAEDGCGKRYLSHKAALDRVASAALPFLDLHLNHRVAAEKELAIALGLPATEPVRVASAQPARPLTLSLDAPEASTDATRTRAKTGLELDAKRRLSPAPVEERR